MVFGRNIAMAAVRKLRAYYIYLLGRFMVAEWLVLPSMGNAKIPIL